MLLRAAPARACAQSATAVDLHRFLRQAEFPRERPHRLREDVRIGQTSGNHSRLLGVRRKDGDPDCEHLPCLPYPYGCATRLHIVPFLADHQGWQDGT